MNPTGKEPKQREKKHEQGFGLTLSLRKVALWLGLAIVAAYAGSIYGGYHFDDSHCVESNFAIRSLKNIPTLWTDPTTSSFIPENRVYRPLTFTFFTLAWVSGDGSTVPFHIMKIAMHFFVCLALFLIWKSLWMTPGWFPVQATSIRLPLIGEFKMAPDWAAFFLALIFAIHPAGSECVDYISATTSLQCAMFYAWAFYSFLLYRESRDPRHLACSLILYFCSVASKEEGITLPAMVAVTEFFLTSEQGKARWKSAFARALPFAVTGAVLAAWIMGMRPVEGHESRGTISSFSYFITQWRAYLWYMRLWFWPWDLNADNAAIVFSSSLLDPLVIRAAIGNGLIILFAWWNRKRFPAMLYGLIWFYITISPASSVVVLAEAINEHRMYLAYLGFVGGTFTVLLWMAETFLAAPNRSRRLGWAYALVMIGLFIGTQERNRVWRTSENLWLDTIEKNPTSGRAYNNLSLVYMSSRRYDEAIRSLEKCEQFWPNYMYCPLNKGISYSALGKTEEAEKAFLRSYSLNPRSVYVNFHLGRFFQETKKDCPRAMEYYQAAIAVTGNKHPSAEVHKAQCLREQKKMDEARTAVSRALEFEPSHVLGNFELGMIEKEANRPDAALEQFEKVVAVEPRHVQAWFNIGVLHLAGEEWEKAIGVFEQVVELDPQNELALYNLAYAAEMSKDGSRALTAARQLATIFTDKKEYRQRVAELEKKFGTRPETQAGSR